VASPTRYADSDGVSIAYQVHGDGPVDLVFVAGFVFHVEAVWEHPGVARLLNRLASFSRLILFDKRGQGLSDRPRRPPTLEESMSDVRAVIDAAGGDHVALLGVDMGGPMSTLFAAAHPERVSALILYGTYARLLRAPDFPHALPESVFDRWGDRVRAGWGGAVGIDQWAPSARHDAAFTDWWARMLRQGTSPTAAIELLDLYREVDVRAILPTIHVPTLVLHRRDDTMIRADQGRYLAEHIPDARYVELPGEDHMLMAGDYDAVLDEIEEMLVGGHRTRDADRVLATVLFTDIVDSTRSRAEMGDRRYGDVVESHDREIRRLLAIHQGREIKTLGDGFLATFDGPARAMRCALAATAAARRLGLEIRAGVHTGELAVQDGDVAGMAVNIGARISALAAPGEVLASSTVKELVVGSGLQFDDRGSFQLKGVPDRWRLFTVRG
jgi:pimeloyl-ACP methyl ester carboxylesterase